MYQPKCKTTKSKNRQEKAIPAAGFAYPPIHGRGVALFVAHLGAHAAVDTFAEWPCLITVLYPSTSNCAPRLVSASVLARASR